MPEIKIDLTEGTIQKIEEMLMMTNIFNEYKYAKKSEWDIESFIKGCVNREIQRYDQYYEFKDKVYNPKATLKNNFEKMRKENGYSQTQLAEVTGIQQTSLSKILNNKGQLRIDSFFRLWIAFDCPPIQKCIDFEDG